MMAKLPKGMDADYQLVAVPTAEIGTDPLDNAKKKFLTAIDHQINLAKDPNYTFKKVVYKDGKKEIDERPRNWVHHLSDGSVGVVPRYGSKPLFGKAGDEVTVVKLTDENEVVKFLEALKKSVEEGELDQDLRDLATRKK